jgi:hypothetical protein
MRWKPPSLRVGLEAQRRLLQPPVPSLEHSEEVDRDVDVDFDHNILVEDRLLYGNGADNVNSGYYNSSPPTSTTTTTHSPPSPPSSPLPSQTQASLSEEDLQSYGPGWRVEFRPLEVQLTDFENAAYAILTVLTARCLVARGYNLYLPMSLVEENMKRAQLKDAVLLQRFYIRRNIFSPENVNNSIFQNTQRIEDCCRESDEHHPIKTDTPCEHSHLVMTPSAYDRVIPSIEDIDIIELSINEILNGESGQDPKRFPGILPMLYHFINSLGCDDRKHVTNELRAYLSLISDRAAGRLPTTAHYLRKFVEQHPDYRGDGTMTPFIADDLLELCEDIGMGRVQCHELYGEHRAVPSLDLVDEEDLMFYNFTCFLQPIARVQEGNLALTSMDLTTIKSIDAEGGEEPPIALEDPAVPVPAAKQSQGQKQRQVKEKEGKRQKRTREERIRF